MRTSAGIMSPARELHHVAGDESGQRLLPRPAVAEDGRGDADHRPQLGGRGVGPGLLHEAQPTPSTIISRITTAARRRPSRGTRRRARPGGGRGGSGRPAEAAGGVRDAGRRRRRWGHDARGGRRLPPPESPAGEVPSRRRAPAGSTAASSATRRDLDRRSGMPRRDAEAWKRRGRPRDTDFRHHVDARSSDG